MTQLSLFYFIVLGFCYRAMSAAEMYAALREEAYALEEESARQRRDVEKWSTTTTAAIDKAAKKREIVTDDDVPQIAGSLPFVSEYILPLLFGYHDGALLEFLQGLLNRPVEGIRITTVDRALMVRCNCPPYLAAKERRREEGNVTDATSSEQSEWYKPKVVLVILKGASLLVPSGASLNNSVYETMNLTCLNNEYMRVRGQPEEVYWRQSRITEDNANLPMMLGFDTCINVTIVRNHSEKAFKGYQSSAFLAAQAGDVQIAGALERQCEYVVQFSAPVGEGCIPPAPWGDLQFRFISLPQFVELGGMEDSATDISPAMSQRLKASPYARWLWFMANHSRVSFAVDIPEAVVADMEIRRVWLALAHVALDDPILDEWSAEAERTAQDTMAGELRVENADRLIKFQTDMDRIIHQQTIQQQHNEEQ